MRQILACSLLLILLSGCGKSDKKTLEQETISLDDLAVTVRDHPRSYFLSDKRGGFLLGSSAQQEAQAWQGWSVNGRLISQDIGRVMIDGRAVDQTAVDSVRVTPLEVVRFFHDGTTETLMPLDRVLDEEQAHALVVTVQTTSPHDILFVPRPEAGFVSAPQGEARSILYRQRSGGGTLAYSAGAPGETSRDGVTVPQAARAIFAVVYSPEDSAGALAQRVLEKVDLLRLSRRDRMERLLRGAYLRTSDNQLTKALRWLQLSLDGLTVEASETTGVAALPWDGSLQAGENAIALAGLDIVKGNYATTANLLRSITRHPGKSVEEGAWFAREAYEHVIASGDTGLVRELYPTVLADISGAMKQTDAFNFLVPRTGSLRGFRMAEQQGLWYNQQTIGSILAAFLRDSTHAAQWALMADLTLSAFNRMFVDTSRSLMYERVGPDGRGSLYAGAGALLCLDMIESEPVRLNTVKSIMKDHLRPYGVAMSATPEAVAGGNLVIRNWMTGQMVYALTRFDCQHISYPVTRRLADRLLTTDMIGVLPEMYDGGESARALGAPASLAAMAEYIRSFYQDYLGVHINMTTHMVALEPKLPDELTSVDFTIFAGSHPIGARYERTPEQDRVTLNGEALPDSLRLAFLWMMKNGDAWRGAIPFHPGSTMTLLFGERDATALGDGKEIAFESVRHLKGFSQREQIVAGEP